MLLETVGRISLYAVAERVVKLPPTVKWKAELVSYKLDHLAEISKQCAGSWHGFFLRFLIDKML